MKRFLYLVNVAFLLLFPITSSYAAGGGDDVCTDECGCCQFMLENLGQYSHVGSINSPYEIK